MPKPLPEGFSQLFHAYVLTPNWKNTGKAAEGNITSMKAGPNEVTGTLVLFQELPQSAKVQTTIGTSSNSATSVKLACVFFNLWGHYSKSSSVAMGVQTHRALTTASRRQWN